MRIFDTQLDTNPSNGRSISSIAELTELVNGLKEREPFFLELAEGYGGTLLIGLGPRISCVQFTDLGGIASMAIAPKPVRVSSSVSFLSADTLTPVPAKYCMETAQALKIASFFVQFEGRDPAYSWIEI